MDGQEPTASQLTKVSGCDDADNSYSLWSSSLPLWKKIDFFARRFRHLPNHFWTALAAAVLILDLLSWTTLSSATPKQRVFILIGALVFAAIWAVFSATRNATRTEAVDVARSEYGRARELFEAGAYSEALHLITRNVSLDPNAGNITLRGRILLRLGRWRDSIADLEAGARLSSIPSNRSMCQINRAIALMMLHQFGPALQVLDEVLKREPKNSLALRWKALAWTSMGRPTSALEFAQQSVSLSPSIAANHATLGVVQARSGDIEEAKGTLDKLLKQKLDSAEDFYYLGLLHAALSEDAKAIDALEISGTRDERFAHRRNSDILLSGLSAAKQSMH